MKVRPGPILGGAVSTVPVWGLLVLAGCPADDGVEGNPETSSEATGPGTTTAGTETGVETETDTDTGTEETETETGEPSSCGDGIVDEGEACDDGNGDDADGCTAACEIGPCGFDWVTRELVLDGGSFTPRLPAALTGPDIVVAHERGEGASTTGLVWASRLDGLAHAAVELDLGSDAPNPDALAVGPDGALYLASADPPATNVSVRRLSPEGDEQWLVSRPAQDAIADLAYAPGDELVLVQTVDNGDMNIDVELAGLDPTDGAELWSHRFGGPPAANGFSTDRGAALVIDDAGRAFVGYDEYQAWDTLAPVVVGFDPGGASEPLWTTTVLEIPGRKLEITDLALGPQGTLALTFMRFDGSQIFWVAALDAQTGVVEWVVERDALGLPNDLSTVRGVAVSEDRILATGSWIADLDGTDVRQGYALGLDLDGNQVCLGTLDDYAPQVGTTSETWLSLTALRDPDGPGFFLGGYVYDFVSGGGLVDLLLAKVR